MYWFWFNTCEEGLDVNIDQERSSARKHINYMLGGPVISIELDDQQIKHAVDLAEAEIDMVGARSVEEYSMLLKFGSLAYAKYMLGRIRIKRHAGADSIRLVEEGLSDIKSFRKYLRG
jgi:hypothetical protein